MPRLQILAAAVLFLLLVLPAFPAGEQPEAEGPVETVVVSASLTPETASQVNREVLVVSGDELRRLPVRTIDDLLAFLAPLDVRPRVAGGLFGDVSLRGASESGVLVCIDGLRWNDPQTGHFNLEIPVPLELIERVEVLCGSQSIYFGADAVGGVIHIITRREVPSQVQAALTAGSFGTGSVSALGAGVRGRWSGQVIAGGARSDGFASDRDYRIGQLMGAARLTHGLGWTDVSAVRLNNRFGAAGFYGPYPSYEETLTDAFWTVTALRAGPFRQFPTECRFSLKRHDDEFTLIRERPDFYRNRNTTRTALFQSTTRLLQSGGTTVAAALEFAGSALDSSRMGRHSIRRGSAAVEVQQEIRPGWMVEGSLRFDEYSSWGGRWTPGAGCSFFLRPDLKLRGYYGQAFRAPTFTELYYQSPGDRGDPGLAPETAQTVEAGADWYARPEFTLSFTVFRRWDREMIDWIRRDPAAHWQAANIGRVDVAGCSLLASGTVAGGVRFQGGYSWNGLDPGVVDYESKYALNYARHHLSALVTAPLNRATWLNAALHFKQRSDGQACVPAYVEVRHSWRDLEFLGRIDNLFDESYEEVPGVAMPGRCLAVGVRFRRVFETGAGK